MNRGAWKATVHRVAQSWTQLKPLQGGTYSMVRLSHATATHSHPTLGKHMVM